MPKHMFEERKPMKLFYAPNTISIAVAIGLEEAGIAYEPVLVDFTKPEQTSETYRAINPKLRVPALEFNGTILTETGALLELIATLAPNATLVPADAVLATHMRETMYYLASTMHVNHAHKGRGYRWADREDSWADMAAKVPETMAASATYVEENCVKGPFVTGDTVSLADPYLFMLCHWLGGDGVDISNYPRLSNFVATMSDRASIKSVREKGLLT